MNNENSEYEILNIYFYNLKDFKRKFSYHRLSQPRYLGNQNVFQSLLEK